MARKEDKTIEIIHHHTGQKAEVKFSAASNQFYCSNRTVIGDIIEGSDFNEVKKLVTERMDELHALQWIPVIIVEVAMADAPGFTHDNTKECAGISFRVDRVWIAPRVKGANPMICKRFNMDDGFSVPMRGFSSVFPQNTEKEKLKVEFDPNRFAQEMYWPYDGKFRVPYREPDNSSRHGSSSRTTYLPYSDELWDGLNAILVAVRNARERLHSILRDEEIVQMVVALANNVSLLTSGVPKEDEDDAL